MFALVVLLIKGITLGVPCLTKKPEPILKCLT